MPLMLRRVSPRARSVSSSSTGSFASSDEEEQLNVVVLWSSPPTDDSTKSSSKCTVEVMLFSFCGLALLFYVWCSVVVASTDTTKNIPPEQLLLQTTTTIRHRHVPVTVFEADAFDQGNVYQSGGATSSVVLHLSEERFEGQRLESAAAVDTTTPASSSTTHIGSLGTTESPSPVQEQPECRLYLAPSTIPFAGLGIFTAVPINTGDVVGDDDVALPLLETSLFNNEGDSRADPVFNPFVNYFWKGQEMGMHRLVSEENSRQVQAFIPGLDSAANCNLALLNVAKSNVDYDDSHLHRSQHAMAGAMTPYHSTRTYATEAIPAGGEVFKFYGDRWFTARSDMFGVNIPLSEDYPAAEKVLQKFETIRTSHLTDKDDLAADLFSLAKDFIGTEQWESRVMNAIPTTLGGAIQAANNGIRSLYQPDATMNLEYLQSQGKCVDHIHPGPSTLPQAGRGAFAKRPLPEGTIITGSPLIHIPRKDFLDKYRMEAVTTVSNSTGKNETSWVRHEVVGQQLVVNYCFTDEKEESTLLLCPYGSGVNYINHNQTLANVKIQWAHDSITRHNSAWLTEKRVEDLEWEYDVGLAFDYVATKEIQEGEELFLDYGNTFERALNDRIANWQHDEDDYTSAERYDKKSANVLIRTEEEQQQEPYPANLELRCHPGLYHKSLVTPSSNSSKIDATNSATEYIWDIRDEGYPCRILERHEHDQGVGPTGSASYKVELKIPLSDLELPTSKHTYTYIRRIKVPRSAISFFNSPYSTDLHLAAAFRKSIGIPTEMFPEQWRNLVKPV